MRREVSPNTALAKYVQGQMCHWSQCIQSCSVSGGDSNNRVSDARRSPGVGGASAMESPGRRQNHSGVVFARARPLADDAVEIFGVFTYQCSTLRCGMSEKLFVGQLRQVSVIGSRDDVVAVLVKSCSRDTSLVHIEDELHPARRP